MTLTVRLPVATLYGLPVATPYMVAKTHGRPSPRKTFTLLLPIIKSSRINSHAN